MNTAQITGLGVAALVLLAGGALLVEGVLPDEQAATGSAQQAVIDPFADDPVIDDSVAPVNDPQPSGTAWDYVYSTDALRGGSITYADLPSDPDFDPAYHGARLRLTRPVQGPVSAEILLSSGRCPSRYCAIALAFDGALNEWQFENTSTGFAATDPEAFVDRIRKADELIVELPTHSFGALQFRFEVEGLEI